MRKRLRYFISYDYETKTGKGNLNMIYVARHCIKSGKHLRKIEKLIVKNLESTSQYKITFINITNYKEM